MKKTQLKVSRRWNTLKNSIRLPSGNAMPIYQNGLDYNYCLGEVMIKVRGTITSWIV